MADQMQFTRQKPNGGAWDFNPGNRMLQINDIRIDRETRQLLLDLFGLGGEQFIDAVLDVIAGSNGIIIERVDDIITISVDPLTMPDFDEAARDALAAALVAGPGITITPNDPDNVITIQVALDDSALAETIRDTVDSTFIAGGGMSITIDDAANTVTFALADATNTYLKEQVQDIVGAFFSGTSGVITSYSDAPGTMVASLDSEFVMDLIAGMLAAGTGLTKTYNDGADTLTFSLTTPVPTTEDIQDVVGALLAAGSGVGVTYDDSGNVETISAVGRTINDQTGTSYTLVLTDQSKWVRCNNASAITLTVPPNSSVAFPIGTEIEGSQAGAGQITLTPGAGVTLNSAAGLKSNGQYSVFGLKKTGTDTWTVYGRTTT